MIQISIKERVKLLSVVALFNMWNFCTKKSEEKNVTGVPCENKTLSAHICHMVEPISKTMFILLTKILVFFYLEKILIIASTDILVGTFELASLQWQDSQLSILSK